MSAVLAAPQSLSYFAKVGQASRDLFVAIFAIKPSEYAECFRTALAMNRIVGARDGGHVSPNQLQELRMMAGVDRATAN